MVVNLAPRLIAAIALFSLALAAGGPAGCATTTSPPAPSTNAAPGNPPSQATAQRSPASSSPLIPDPATLPVDAVAIETVVEGLEHPWGMAWLPNGDILITERPGRLRIVRGGRLDPTPIAGVAEVSGARARQLFASSQGGLLDVALHPRFSDNGWLYLSYAHGSQEANRTRVARARFDGTALRDWRVIFEVNRTKSGGQHFGSRLLWLPDQTLLISIGDGGNPPLRLDGDLIRNQAQNSASQPGRRIGGPGPAPLATQRQRGRGRRIHDPDRRPGAGCAPGAGWRSVCAHR